MDHEELTYKRNGAEVSVTDNQGARVVTELVASAGCSAFGARETALAQPGQRVGLRR